jgi:hypothetical protein
MAAIIEGETTEPETSAVAEAKKILSTLLKRLKVLM